MTEKKTSGTRKASTRAAGTKAKAAAERSAAKAPTAEGTALEVGAENPAAAPAAEIKEAKVRIEASKAPTPGAAVAGEATLDVAEVEDALDEASDLGPPPDGMFSLEKCVEFVLRAIVQNQEALTIVRTEEPDKVRIHVAVAPEDLGKVIGKQGRTINALRTVVKTAAARTNTQVVVDLEGKAV